MQGFWPSTALGWVGLVGAALGILAAFGWVVPLLKRRLGLAGSQDVRVKVKPVILGIQGPIGGTRLAIMVRVENHSKSEFFLSGIGLHESKNGPGLITPSDFATGRTNCGAVIKPGDAYEFCFSERLVKSAKNRDRLRYAVAVDKLGRRFRSRRGQLPIAIAKAITTVW